jgi:uncharacterized damage-inducible protein DinB
MPRIVEPFMAELDHEAATTRKVLERVPSDKYDWRPHPKSMSLGMLASHIATLPSGTSKLMMMDSFDVPADMQPPPVVPHAELLRTFEESIRSAKDVVGSFDDQRAMSVWRLRIGGKEAFSAPRVVVLRSFMLNHWYHHRGQLSVYLRLLDIPVPSIYGPSADENPFAAM